MESFVRPFCFGFITIPHSLTSFDGRGTLGTQNGIGPITEWCHYVAPLLHH